jgi:hypothetical protein
MSLKHCAAQNQVQAKSGATPKSGACQLKPKGDGAVESHPFDSAQGRLFRKVRGRMGHPTALTALTPAPSDKEKAARDGPRLR